MLLIGGDHGMGGAIRLAGQAALRSGAGLVRVLTRAEHVAPLLAACPELMVETWSPAALHEALAWADVLAIGPGLGRRDWGRRALAAIVDCQRPDRAGSARRGMRITAALRWGRVVEGGGHTDCRWDTACDC